MKKLNKSGTIVLCATLISSCLLFYFQNIVTRYVKSSDFCDAYVYNTLKWIIPKVIIRCNLLNEVGTRDYFGTDIMIVLDVWIAICCVASLIYFARTLIVNPNIITRVDMLEYYAGLRRDKSRVKSAIYFFSGIAVFFMLFVFVYSPAISDEGGFEGLISLTSSHGIGVIIHAVIATSCSYSLLIAILASRTMRALSTGNIR